MRPFFRFGDRVTAHEYFKTYGKPVNGRVLCVNRKSEIGMTVVVLLDLGTYEQLETFKPDGTAYLPEDSCHLTLGWNNVES